MRNTKRRRNVLHQITTQNNSTIEKEMSVQSDRTNNNPTHFLGHYISLDVHVLEIDIQHLPRKCVLVSGIDGCYILLFHDRQQPKQFPILRCFVLQKRFILVQYLMKLVLRLQASIKLSRKTNIIVYNTQCAAYSKIHRCV